MKKYVLPLIAFVAICSSFSIKSKKGFTPPGTIQINDSLFADETEVSNQAWCEYESWCAEIYGKNSKEHLASLPDTNCWKEKLSYNEPYVQYYYRHPAYKEFPVVGVSYEQTLAYCKWRTDQVKLFLTIRKDFKNQNISYRLPTKKEWENMSAFSSGVLNNQGKDEKGGHKLNCLITKENGDASDPTAKYNDVTVPVKSYSKNLIGFYNLLGNVAEMVNEQGICKGGSWRNRVEECRVGNDLEYSKPTAWLGFRCVCVVKKL